MFLNKIILSRFRSSLRWKVAAFYATAFFLTLLLCFSILYWMQYRGQTRSLHKQLTVSSNILETAYLRGEVVRTGESCILPDRIPSEILQPVREKFPDFNICMGIRTRGEYTQLLGTFGGSAAILHLETLQWAKVSGDHVALLEREFNENFCDEWSTPFFFLLVSQDKKVLARSAFPERYVQSFLGAMNESNKKNRNGDLVSETEMRGHDVLIHVRQMHDGTVLISGIGESAMQSARQRLLILLIICLAVAPLFGGAAGWFIGGRIADDIQQLTRTARAAEDGDYSVRVTPDSKCREIHDLARAFNAMARNTEKVLSELRTISDNVAHDLKTPVTRLHGKAELAIIADSGNELACDVAEECANMLKMINTMLELTRTENGVAEIRKDPVDLSGLIENMTDLYLPAAEDAGVVLHCRNGEELFIAGDKEKLQRLVSNLLDNALKFTPDGGTVTIAASLQNGKALLTVSDTGEGIAEQDLPHIFDRFFRADSSRTIPGSGLGLCLVKAITEAHGGTIRVESEVGNGTTFFIEFPIKVHS